jgi:peptidoglycan/xylan/chitin deacetylase (PgdA/CDA1 family)
VILALQISKKYCAWAGGKSKMFKQSFKRALIASGAMRVASRFTGKGVAIIMYHSVRDEPAASFNTLGGIIHSTTVFRAQMETIARHFDPVRLDDVLGFVRGEKNLPARPVVVTFDDGYADNYQIAKPILDQTGVPGVFYVVADCIRRQILPWPSQLRHAFLTGKRNSWEDSGKKWPLETREQRLLAFEEASKHCCKLTSDKQDAYIESVRVALEAERPVTESPPMMTREELRALIDAGHTVGSHTVTHPNMAQVSGAEARLELTESKQILEHELERPVVHFSYPCPALQPHWSDHTVDLSREAGYVTGVTTNGGLVRRGDNALRLRRITPTKTIEGVRWNLECAFAGSVV